MHESACSRRGSLPLHDLRSRRQALMMRTNYESCCLSEIGKDRCTQYRNKTRSATSGSRASSIYIQISTTTNDNNTVTNNYKLVLSQHRHRRGTASSNQNQTRRKQNKTKTKQTSKQFDLVSAFSLPVSHWIS